MPTSENLNRIWLACVDAEMSDQGPDDYFYDTFGAVWSYCMNSWRTQMEMKNENYY